MKKSARDYINYSNIADAQRIINIISGKIKEKSLEITILFNRMDERYQIEKAENNEGKSPSTYLEKQLKEMNLYNTLSIDKIYEYVKIRR